MIRFFTNLSVGHQIRATVMLALILAMSSSAALVYRSTYNAYLNNTLASHQSQLDSIALTIAGQYNSYRESLGALDSAFRQRYLDNIGIGRQEETINNHKTHMLTVGGTSLYNNNAIVDSFTQDTGAVATVFAPAGNDWLRVSSSVRDQHGQRVVGSTLGLDHPARSALMNGQSYSERVNLLGDEYLAIYTPVQLPESSQVAVVFVGLSLQKATEDIFASLNQIKWGDTGYTIVVSNEEDSLGRYLLHPVFTQQDPAIIDITDYNGERPFDAIFARPNGRVMFEWGDENHSAEKYLIFSEVPGWNWKLLGGTYVYEVTSDSKDLLQLTVAIAVAAIVLAYFAVSIYLNQIINPLRQLSKVMERLGEGEISVQVERHDSNTHNELRLLSNSAAIMADNLNNLVGHIRNTSDHVLTASDKLSSDAKQNQHQLMQQQNQVDMVVTAVEEMATSAQSVASQVESIAEGVRSADQESSSGYQSVEAVALSMAELNNLLDESSKAVTTVSQESENIQAVTRIIDEIAEQTNLLALNAAIEAARAGEHGRGFAVVADEVRTLAHRTQSSVQDVIKIIGQLKHSTDNAVTLMETSRNNAEMVLEKTQVAGAALESITEQVRNITAQAEGIAATSEQQAQVSHEVAANAAEISELNQQSHKISEQTASSATQMQQSATELHDHVASLR